MTATIVMPDTEADHLRACYKEARVILEYGSGGSTELAAQMPGKLVISVESDRGWARALRRKISEADPVAPVIVHHVDIGATGAWGRPVDDRNWKAYHRYPNTVWDAPFFRHPDLVLIDGRFRTACLMTVILRCVTPVTVLFDDYADRPRYHLVEQIIRPVRLIGRLAEFRVVPGLVKPADIGFVIGEFFQATTATKDGAKYDLTPAQVELLHQIRLGPQQGHR